MVGFGRKCQKLGRKPGQAENRWLSWRSMAAIGSIDAIAIKNPPKGKPPALSEKSPPFSMLNNTHKKPQTNILKLKISL